MCDAAEYYKIAKHVLNQKGIKFDEDIIQDIVTHIHKKMQTYDESRGKVSTYIGIVTMTRYLEIVRERSTLKNKANYDHISLDTVVHSATDGDDITLMDVTSDDTDIVKTYIRKKILESILPLVEEPLMMWLMGEKQVNIANKIGVTQATVSRIIKHNIERIKQYCKENGIEYEI